MCLFSYTYAFEQTGKPGCPVSTFLAHFLLRQFANEQKTSKNRIKPRCPFSTFLLRHFANG